MEGRSKNAKVQIIEIPEKWYLKKGEISKYLNNGDEFSRLKKEKRAPYEKSHGESKGKGKQNILKKKILPLANLWQI